MDPLYFPGHVPQRRQSTPAEPLFELYVERNDARWLCELRDEGAHYGVEVQLFQNEEFRYRRRFKTRALAVQWAEAERKRLEKGGT